MKKSKVTPSSIFDKNGLDPTSVNQHHSQKLSGNQILQSFNIKYLPLFELIFKVYFSTYLTWNDYFQFIIFFCFAPNVAVFYLILHTLPDYKDVVSWKDIQKLIQQLEKQEDVDSQVTLVYQKIDVNNHGYISLNQFFKFVIETPSIWEPIYLFRLSLIDGTFTHSQLFTIMKRRVRIPYIKQYLFTHNGQPHPDHFDYDNGDLNSSNTVNGSNSNNNNNNNNNNNSNGVVSGGINVNTVGLINNSNSLLDTTPPNAANTPNNTPNNNNNVIVATTPGFRTRSIPTSSPTRFSFFNNQNNLNNNNNNNNNNGSNSNINNNNNNNSDIITTFSGITTVIIKKFKPDYTTKKHDAFAMKYLSQFNQFTVLAQIDSIYITYRSLNPVSVKSIIIRSQNHSLVVANNMNNTSSFSHYIRESSNRNSSSTGGADSTGTSATTTPLLQSQGRHLQRPNSILRRSNRLSAINNNNASMMSMNGGESTGRKLTATPIFLGHGRHLSIQSKQMIKLNNGTLKVSASVKAKQVPSIPEKNEVGELDEEEEEEDSHNSIPFVLDYNDDSAV